MTGFEPRQRLLERIDERPDGDFYTWPRFVTHIDPATIDALTQVYRERLPHNGEILDLMSSWVSHLPDEVPFARVAGLGMNRAELAANPRLGEFLVHDLNRDPRLPFADASFDAVLNAVSVQYLTQPVAVFAEVCRVLRPGGEVLVAVSQRVFPTKAVAVFRNLPPAERPLVVARYAELAGDFEPAVCLDRSPGAANGTLADPLWVVAARRRARAGAA